MSLLRLTTVAMIAAMAVSLVVPLATLAATDRGSLGPFEIHDADSNSVRLALAFQTRLDFESKETGDDDRDNDLRMSFKSIRPIVTGRLLSDRLSFKLHFNLIPGSPELMDMYFGWKVDPRLRIRFGQFKVPFTRYRIQSLMNLTLVNWSITSRYFGAERQIGVAVHNGYEKPPRFEYAVGIFTGQNARASHGTGMARVYGVTLESPSNLAGSGGTTEFSPELVARVGYNSGGIKIQSDSDPERGPLRYSLGVSGAYDLDPIPYRDFTWRVAPELLVKCQGMSAALVGYLGGAEIGAPGEDMLVMRGLLGQAAYRIDRNWEIAARWATVQLTDKLIREIRDYATRVDAGNGPTIPLVDARTELAAGVSYYVLEHKVKLQLTFDWQRDFEDREDFAARTQFQLMF